ncbi:MAG: histidinol-phosphatase [Alphaproteobacteria bacterium]|nr:histidinol-phosphatase [Alphaproteobacteria bacterium]
MTPAELDRLAAFAGELADAAGVAIRPYFRQPIAIDDKADNSPVTIADRKAEQAIRALIKARHPDHGIIGEEFGEEGADRPLVWVLDPIDGTRSFIAGMPLFGCLVALLENGRPVIGVIDQPVSGERWLGVSGRPATFNGRPIRTRALTDLAAATLFTTTTETYGPRDLERFRALRRAVKLTRYSADCYAFGLLAMGFVDIVVEAGHKVYDYAALVPVVENAGGVITDWQGRPLGLGSDGRVLAAGNAALHGAALALLAA